MKVFSEDIKEIFYPFFRKVNFSKGNILWHEGDTNGTMILIESGRVKIFRVMPDGSSVTFFILHTGDLFGLLPMVDGGPYPVSAETLEDVSALAITHQEFKDVLKKNPSLALLVMKHLSAHLRNAFDIIARRSTRDALPVVASALLSLAKKNNSTGNIITLPVASREYAMLIGITPETLSRKITKLVKLGILERVDVNSFKIINISQLKSLSFPLNFL
ncbi:MAG: Crp/Fnr family transcriptional regulator [Bacteroidales bacterium]